MNYRLFDGDTSSVSYSHSRPSVESAMKSILKARGLATKENIDSFLSPSYEASVQDPFLIKDMDKAAKRIVVAMEKGEKLAIYSDYDCDGIPGGTILSDFFDHIGYTNREHYIPHRHKEGYGLNTKAIDALHEKGVTLIITVDNGITAVDEVLYGKEKGVEIIVTDHHLPLRDEDGKQLLPNAYAVINSKRDDCTYHDDMLCGSAVAWKLVCAVLTLLRTPSEGVEKKTKKKNVSGGDFKKILDTVAQMPLGYEKWWLDLVAVATIADLVPLVKENRALAYYGLHVLRKSPRAGLQKLLALSKTKQRALSARDVAFTIAPRVNAASRMAEPILAYHMLRKGHDDVAIAHAITIEDINTKRKAAVKDIKREVMGHSFSDDTHVIVLGQESWGPGVLGLIAQEVLEETGKPTFVWGKGEEDGVYKGSCRAPDGVDVVQLMNECRDHFIGIGGHELAGGFVIAQENVEGLEELLHAAYIKLGFDTRAREEEETVVDAELTFDDVDKMLHRELEKLEPTGQDNPTPLFLFRSDGALSMREFGKQGGHFELMYPKGSGASVKAISFFGDKEKLEKAKGPHQLIAEIEESHFGYTPELRLRVIDIV